MPAQNTLEELTQLMFARIGASSWRKDSAEFNAFVLIEPVEGVVEAFLEKSGNVSTSEQYSERFSVAYGNDVDGAVILCAKHLVSLLDEHHKSGTVSLIFSLARPPHSVQLAALS